MPSHIFTRLGYWAESATTNENAWRTSEADVKRVGESGAYRDFHASNYLQYAYLQLGRFRNAKRVTGIIEAQHQALPNKKTTLDTPDLQARHVRGRTIYALPDRVVYGYFDMLTRLIVESGDWSAVDTIPLVAPSRDFLAMQLHVDAMAAARRRDPTAARAVADQLERLAGESGQHPLGQAIITLQAKEARGLAAPVSPGRYLLWRQLGAGGGDNSATATYLRSLTIDETLGLTNPDVFFYTADALGSTLAVSDTSANSVTEYTYADFGAVSATNPGFPNPFQFTGRENDATGLYYYRARYYHPSLQRFISQDPTGLLGGDVNLYSYSRRNPILFVDPLGLDVTIAYYPTFATHAGIGVDDNPTVGFYPANAFYGLVSILGFNVPGIARRDTGIPAKVVKIKTTKRQDRIIQEAINARIANPGAYNLYGRNCSLFVTDVLRAAGVPISPTWLPENLVNQPPTSQP